MSKLGNVIKLTISSIFFLGVGALILSYFIQYNRPIPDNLNVFVIAADTPPKEFYSSPHAYRLLQQGISLERMPFKMARDMKIPMAERSKDDFSCIHNAFAWWLIDNDMWPNSCRWNSRGEWQNSQWPHWLESILRSVGFFK